MCRNWKYSPRWHSQIQRHKTDCKEIVKSTWRRLNVVGISIALNQCKQRWMRGVVYVMRNFCCKLLLCSFVAWTFVARVYGSCNMLHNKRLTAEWSRLLLCNLLQLHWAWLQGFLCNKVLQQESATKVSYTFSYRPFPHCPKFSFPIAAQEKFF